MKNAVRIAYTYGDLNKVIDRCICSDSHTQKFILLQNKQLIIEMLNILWNAQKFVAYTKEFHFEINRDEIRGYLIRKLRACDIEAVFNMIKVPAGCRSYTLIENKKEKLSAMRPLTPGEVERLAEEFMIDFTYNSNAIEGNTLTLKEPALALEGIVPIAVASCGFTPTQETTASNTSVAQITR